MQHNLLSSDLEIIEPDVSRALDVPKPATINATPPAAMNQAPATSLLPLRQRMFFS